MMQREIDFRDGYGIGFLDAVKQLTGQQKTWGFVNGISLDQALETFRARITKQPFGLVCPHGFDDSGYACTDCNPTPSLCGHDERLFGR